MGLRTWQSGGWGHGVFGVAVGLLGLAAHAATPAASGASAMSVPVAPEPARVIVKLRASVLEPQQQSASGVWRSAQGWSARHEAAHQRMQGLTRRVGASLGESRELGPNMHLARASGISSQELARRLTAQADVAFAVVDERRHVSTATPNDPFFGTQPGPNGTTLRQPAAGQWYLRAPDGSTPSAIDAPAAWSLTPGSRSVVVAVLDTGIRYDHADLQGKLLPGYNMISVPLIAGNEVGRNNNPSDLGDYITQSDVDRANQIRPGFFDLCPLNAHTRSTWHGTQVAGLIGAATHNNIGMAGLGQEVQILPVRVLGKCGGYDSDIIDGMRWAAGLAVSGVPLNPFAAKVINLSLGSEGTCSAAYTSVISELAAMNVMVVAAAGNSEGKATQVPANCPGVVAVTALTHSGNKARLASAGTGSDVFIAAPGGDCTGLTPGCDYPLLTTYNSGTTVPQANGSTYTDAFVLSAGTSFAAPLVSGTAALMWSVNPGLSLSDLKALLGGSARPFLSTGAPPCHVADGNAQNECVCTNATCGAGMLDAGAAVGAAAAAATTPVAVVSLSPNTPTVGVPLTLSSGDSRPGPGAGAIISRQWTLLSGGGIVTSSGGVGNTLTVTPTGKGVFRVRLSVTDSQSQVHQTELSIPVEKTVSITEGPFLARSSGGGGGGASDAALLALMGLAALYTAGAWLSRGASRAA